jgi:hypothetical protein
VVLKDEFGDDALLERKNEVYMRCGGRQPRGITFQPDAQPDENRTYKCLLVVRNPFEIL